MKTIKLICSMIILCLCLAGCKKDDVNLDDPDTMEVPESIPGFRVLTNVENTTIDNIVNEETRNFIINITPDDPSSQTFDFYYTLNGEGDGFYSMDGIKLEKDKIYPINLSTTLVFTPTKEGNIDIEYTIADNYDTEFSGAVHYSYDNGILNPDVSSSPVFNFNVRDLLEANTLPASQRDFDIIFYLKQQNIYNPGETYHIKFTCDPDIDGILAINGQEYRQNDDILIKYDNLYTSNKFETTGHYTPFKIVPQHNYVLNFTVSDTHTPAVTAQLSIKE
jgi:hypothetical protein